MELSCPHCGNAIFETDKFCGQCGKKITLIKEEKEKSGLQLVIGFYVAYLVFAIVSYAIYDESTTLATEIAIEAIFILLTVLFTLFDARRVFALYNFRWVTWKGVVFSLVFPIASGFLVYYGVDLMNGSLFGETDNVFDTYSVYTNSVFWVMIFYTIIPPIFEELAFRGFLFNQLRAFASSRVTILATAFIFALVHFSFLSLLWIFPFGIVLGYLRHKYKTLYLGMIVHFIHNFLVVMIDYYYYLPE